MYLAKSAAILTLLTLFSASVSATSDGYEDPEKDLALLSRISQLLKRMEEEENAIDDDKRAAEVKEAPVKEQRFPPIENAATDNARRPPKPKETRNAFQPASDNAAADNARRPPKPKETRNSIQEASDSARPKETRNNAYQPPKVSRRKLDSDSYTSVTSGENYLDIQLSPNGCAGCTYQLRYWKENHPEVSTSKIYYFPFVPGRKIRTR